MKHLFLINPAAGKRDSTFDCAGLIHARCDARGLDYEIRVSKKPGDLTRYAREAAAEGGELRLYACGGDGTLNEVVNGAAGCANAAVTHWPTGSGNDFVKLFSDPARFRDLDALLDGEETRLDLIRCGTRRAVNICSMGFDARVGTEIAKYKRLPLLSGSGAYIASAGINLIRGIHQPCTVEVAGERLPGEKSLVCVCSGRWYGGGFNPVPEAEPDDGLLDVLVVKGVSRFGVARLIGVYKAGRYRELPDLIRHFRVPEVRVICEKESVINLDGEAAYGRDVTFRAEPRALRFFYPRGLTYHAAAPAAAGV